ncbi:MAG: ABC transporter ATP-binding protein [Firmicutes bacterium]|nr:ABC transporter ATP-binding protein [Bacillota bacterium]MBR7148004.1 ABC transporter ATP-binding protein [Bacillota bacterium]
MLELKKVTKLYSGRRGVSAVDLAVGPGEIVGLFGENGAGKTTLLKCILGYFKYNGEITLDGAPINSKNIDRLAFATSEHSFFPNMSPADHKVFYQMNFPKFNERRFEGLMEFFELPKNRALKQFSVGQKNQFEVILALSQGADYILMDEPFAGNDVFNREDFYKVLLGILEPNETIILSTHLLEEVESFIGRAVLLRKGKIVGDVTTDELEESGRSLMDFVKQTYNYETDRVIKALSKMTDEE